VGVYGSMNSLLFLGVVWIVWTRKPKSETQKPFSGIP
jgi:hypothetical protein